MTAAFKSALERILHIEGRYSDHRDDPGGQTAWGITASLARQYGYDGRMYDMPLAFAGDIYYKHFWRHLQCDRVHQLSPDLAWELFDIGVNAGRHRAAEFFQRTLNVFNRQESDYSDLRIDGAIGPKTLSAFSSFYQKRGTEGLAILARAVEDRQGNHYQTLAESSSKFESFMYGWYRQRIVND